MNNEEEKSYEVLCELPRNIRQVGELPSHHRVYIEDYAYTYIKQYAGKQEEEVLLLLGNKFSFNEQLIIMIHGALKLSKEYIQEGLTKEIISESQQQGEDFFEDHHIVGWMISRPGMGVEAEESLLKVQQQFFNEDNNVVFIVDAVENEERFYRFTDHRLNIMSGFIIYYEKNRSMHDYMLSHSMPKKKEKESVPVEKALINLKEHKLKEKENQIRENKRFITMLSMISGILIVLCGLLGYGLMTNMDDVQDLKVAFNYIADKYSHIEDHYVEAAKIDEAVVEAMADVSQNEGTVGQNRMTDVKETLPETQKADIQTTAQPPKDKEQPSKTQQNEQQVVNEVTEKVSEKVTEVVAVQSPQTYVVKNGDNLLRICQKNYGSIERLEEIKDLNNIKNEDVIFIGQKLLLP